MEVKPRRSPKPSQDIEPKRVYPTCGAEHRRYEQRNGFQHPALTCHDCYNAEMDKKHPKRICKECGGKFFSWYSPYQQREITDQCEKCYLDRPVLDRTTSKERWVKSKPKRTEGLSGPSDKDGAQKIFEDEAQRILREYLERDDGL